MVGGLEFCYRRVFWVAIVILIRFYYCHYYYGQYHCFFLFVSSGRPRVASFGLRDL